MTSDQIDELEITGTDEGWPAVASEMPRLIAAWRRERREVDRLIRERDELRAKFSEATP